MSYIQRFSVTTQMHLIAGIFQEWEMGAKAKSQQEVAHRIHISKEFFGPRNRPGNPVRATKRTRRQQLLAPRIHPTT